MIKRLINFLNKNKTAIFIMVIFAVFLTVIYIYISKYFYVFKGMNRQESILKIRAIIKSYGKYSALAFIILQIMQVIIFFIPGEIVQIAGGYIFGTFIGSIISIIGITLGSMVTYYISYFMGRPFVQKIVQKKKLAFIDKALSEGKINHVVFILYLIPGLPKDILGYVCGVSDIDAKDFFMYSTLGRIPCIIISALFGAGIAGGSRTMLIVISVIMIALTAVGVFRGEVIVDAISQKMRKKRSN